MLQGDIVSSLAAALVFSLLPPMPPFQPSLFLRHSSWINRIELPHMHAMASVRQASSLAPFVPGAHVIGSLRLPQRRRAALSSLLVATQFPTLLAFTLSLFMCCPIFVMGASDRFCDPLLMAYVTIDQRGSHCLDSSWQLPPSSLVTLHFTVTRCSPSSPSLHAEKVSQIGGYAVQAEGVYLLKRFRDFGPDDYDVALNDSFVLPRHLAERLQPIPLEVLLIDHEEGLSSRFVLCFVFFTFFCDHVPQPRPPRHLRHIPPCIR